MAVKRYLLGLICIFLAREVEYHFIFIGRLGFLFCQLPDQIFSVFLLDCFVFLFDMWTFYMFGILIHCRLRAFQVYGLPFYFLYAIFCCTKFNFNVGKLKVMKMPSLFSNSFRVLFLTFS